MRRSTVYLALGVLAVTTATGAETEVRLANTQLELRFSRATGRWLSLRDATRERPLMSSGEDVAPVTLTTDGQSKPTGDRPQLSPLLDARSFGRELKVLHWRTEQSSLTLEAADGDWRIEQQYALDRDTIKRRVRLTWNRDSETLLRWVDLATPMLSPERTILEAPGRPAVLHQPLDALPMGEWGPMKGWSFGPLVAFRSGDSNLLVWGFDKAIPSQQVGVSRGNRGVWVSQRFSASCRVRKGQTVEIGTQYIRLHRGRLEEALAGFQRFWDDIGLRPVTGTPVWAKDARIYEVHLGSKPFRHAPAYAPYRDVAALTVDLPRIAGMGFNIVHLMPRFPFPGYAVHDYLDIATQYAPEAGLRAMVERAHRLGVKVILDVVLHGVCDQVAGRPIGGFMGPSPFAKHPWLAEHPDWFSRTEDGKVAKTYTWSFDHASPSFRDFLARVLSEYVRKLDVDGFRIDAPFWNLFPNWGEGLPRPGYLSTYGSASMLERARREVLRIKPEVIFYIESTWPLFRTSGDMFYAHDEQRLWGSVLPVVSKRGYEGGGGGRPRNARELLEWLDLQRRAWPRGWIKIHYADSHDSHEWGSLGMFKKEAFGPDAARMLFAFAAFIDGGVMNYAGGEVGSEEYYRKVLALRGSTPALREGGCDYLAVRPGDDRVAAPLRRHGDNWALPVLCFSAAPVTTVIPLDALGLNANARYTLREAFSGEVRQGSGKELNRLKVELPAHGVQLWMRELP